ncbi:MAG: helix-turn-helix transcriptional regulator [Desulfobacteraceae bacterium]|nr:helix-turn-helix transcriptional regulator [Desulfobacteraceae bacterium]
MEGKQFSIYRKKLHKTQKQMAELLGVSLKAVHSYEQGWRTIPGHVERQILFLFTRLKSMNKMQKQCWKLKKCPDDRKKHCPAWEFQTGKLCWFINGTICDGSAHKTWKEKMKVCRHCDVFTSLIGSIEEI